MHQTAIQNKRDLRLARQLWNLTPTAIATLRQLNREYRLSVAFGDLLYLSERWYVTHTGLLRIAERRRCSGIEVVHLSEFTDPGAARWAFKATVFKSLSCKGFVGYGDADPYNVSPRVRGAEMRVAETRAVNQALRKAYGIGICSVEELGPTAEPRSLPAQLKKPAQPAAENHSTPKVRDRLLRLIRQHQLDPNLVKAYAIEFCGTKTLREASREQVEKFVAHLADWAEKDRNALLCQLNSYLPAKERAA